MKYVFQFIIGPFLRFILSVLLGAIIGALSALSVLCVWFYNLIWRFEWINPLQLVKGVLTSNEWRILSDMLTDLAFNRERYEVEVKDLYEIEWPSYTQYRNLTIYRDGIVQQCASSEDFDRLKSLMPPYYTLKDDSGLFINLSCNEWKMLVPCGWATKVDIEDIDYNKVKKA